MGGGIYKVDLGKQTSPLTPLLWRRGGESRAIFQEQSFSLLSFRAGTACALEGINKKASSILSFRPKRSGVEKSVIEIKSGNGEFCLSTDLSTSSRGQNSLLSFRAGTACALERINKKINSIFVPLNKGESEERAGGFFSFSKTTHGPLKTSYGKLAFTLVELIVVIVILGVLATVGFLAFANYPKQARDTVRISNLKEIEKALEFYKIKDGDYPIPTNAQTGTIEGYSGIVWYKGTFGEDLTNQIQEITKTPLDPKTNAEYSYELTPDKQSYRLTANLEIKDADTGKKEHTVNNKITYPNSCAQILEDGFSNGDGNYMIRPNGQEIEVKCDMTNGGYTRYLHIKQNYSFEDAKSCFEGKIISNANIDCFNPNRFGMYARDFMMKQDGNTYFYKNNSPKPSTNTLKSCIGYYLGEKADYYTLGGSNYMTVIGKDALSPHINIDDLRGIFLGLNYCIGAYADTQIGQTAKNHKYGVGDEGIGYVNYVSTNFGRKKEGHINYEKNIIGKTEIYIK